MSWGTKRDDFRNWSHPFSLSEGLFSGFFHQSNAQIDIGTAICRWSRSIMARERRLLIIYRFPFSSLFPLGRVYLVNRTSIRIWKPMLHTEGIPIQSESGSCVKQFSYPIAAVKAQAKHIAHKYYRRKDVGSNLAILFFGKPGNHDNADTPSILSDPLQLRLLLPPQPCDYSEPTTIVSDSSDRDKDFSTQDNRLAIIVER